MMSRLTQELENSFEKIIRNSGKFLSAFFNQLPLLIMFVHNNEIKGINKAGIDILKLNEADNHDNLSIESILPHFKLSTLIPGSDLSLTGKKNSVNITLPDNKIATLDITVIQVSEKNREFLLIGEDITEKVQLSSKNTLNRFILDSINESVFLINQYGNIIDTNSRACQLLDYSRYEITSFSIEDVDPNIPAHMWKILLNKMKEKGIVRFKSAAKKKDGSYFPIEEVIYPLEEKDESFSILLISDISQQVKTEEHISKLSTAVEQSANSIVITDIDGNIEYVNNRFQEITGYSYDEVVGKNPGIIKSGIHSKGFYLELWNTIKSGSIWKGEICNKKKNNELYWESSTITPVHNYKNEICSFISIKEDITEKRKAALALKESEEKLRNIFLASPNSIAIIDTEGRIMDCNEAKLNLFGYSWSELNQMSVLQLFDNKDQKKAKIFWDILLSKGLLKNFELRCRKQNNELFFAECSGSVIRDNQGDAKIIILSIEDITLRKTTERKILHATIDTEEKERKRFAEDLHDELGPFLSGIKLYINELEYQDQTTEQRRELIDYLKQMVDEAVQKTKSISNNLMPNILIDYGLVKAIRSFCSKLNATGQITIAFKVNDPHIRLSKTLEVILYRITIELINNTLKHASAKHVTITLNITNNMLLLSYLDDGEGFDLHNTIEQKKGLGLQNIINRINTINGKYKFWSKPGKGIRFEIEVDQDQL